MEDSSWRRNQRGMMRNVDRGQVVQYQMSPKDQRAKHPCILYIVPSEYTNCYISSGHGTFKHLSQQGL